MGQGEIRKKQGTAFVLKQGKFFEDEGKQGWRSEGLRLGAESFLKAGIRDTEGRTRDFVLKGGWRKRECPLAGLRRGVRGFVLKKKPRPDRQKRLFVSRRESF